jgi:hypothetical protein
MVNGSRHHAEALRAEVAAVLAHGGCGWPRRKPA